MQSGSLEILEIVVHVYTAKVRMMNEWMISILWQYKLCTQYKLCKSSWIKVSATCWTCMICIVYASFLGSQCFIFRVWLYSASTTILWLCRRRVCMLDWPACHEDLSSSKRYMALHDKVNQTTVTTGCWVVKCHLHVLCLFSCCIKVWYKVIIYF